MSKRGKGKVIWLVAGGLLVAGGGTLGGLYATYEAEIIPGYTLGEKPLTGLRGDVEKQFDAWYNENSESVLSLSEKAYGDKVFETSLAKMGCAIDSKREADELKYRDFFTDLIGGYKEAPKKSIEVSPKLTCELTEAGDLKEFVIDNHPEIGKASVSYKGGEIAHKYEQVSMELDDTRLEAEILKAFEGDGKGDIPLKHAPKHIPDKELDRISKVMSEFKTTFSAGNVSRSTNVRLAASRIDGTVLMPGETFSFNDHLGRRTTANGFKVAGVYVSGRHDFDVGGGICQVSTTLYNAAIRSDLKIPVRSSHSLPVPYVPLGQDAAVSFPNPDLKITNSYDFPIALSATPEKSTITFRILGEVKPEYTYKFESKLISSWDRGEKIVHDPSLKYGVRKVVDKGGSGKKVRTWRLIYKNGELLKKVVMNDSTYGGGPRIIAVNKTAKPAVTPPTESLPVSVSAGG